MGYGIPTKGIYSHIKGGYKTFGSIGQGDSNLGVKDDNELSELTRTMLVTVTALSNFD